MRTLRLIVAAALAVWLTNCGEATAAKKTISWSDELCENSFAFDPGKVDEQRVKNTVHLLFGPADFEAPFVQGPFTPQAIATLDLDGTTRMCKNALDLAGRLDFVPLGGIEEFRRARIAEIKDTCEFDSVRIRGFREPSVLREYEPAAACSGFVDALEGKKDLLAAFRETLDQNCAGNVSPAQCVEAQLAKTRKADGLEWARLYLMTFGWSNCAVKYNQRNIEAKKLEQMRLDLEGKFRRAFKVVEKHCDPPVDSHPEFGPTAVFETDLAPGTSADQWNIVAVGLFCGSGKLYPGRIVGYFYGIGYNRLKTAAPLAATFDFDGKASQLTLKPYDDVVLATLDAVFVRNLLTARSASVRIKDYNSPSPDRLKLDDVAGKLKSALKKCHRF